ncbi:MAG: T9SS type A sorting domain-containing protein [Bacteroidetes bacterium]|nr:T9SS type A sorting domain-containing protein [Bacteroidota bacterium]
MSVDPVTGYIYVVYASKSVNGDADVMLVKSTDNGTSWSTPIKVNNDNTNTDQWFPWIDISTSGEINVVFYDSRVDPSNNNLSEVYIARSIDGGNTFGNYDISNSPFQPQALPNSPSGYFMGDYIGVTSANQKAFPVWTDNTSGTFQLYTSKVNYNQSVTIDQKRESGASLTGTTVAKWEGSSFVNYQVPAIFNFSTGSSVVLKGLQDVVQSPSEKFNRWNVDANVINHRTFTIEPGMNQIISQFKSIQSGITIENLLESSSVGNGTISFADPWLIDFNETPYGTRNQGTNAPFKSRTSPFTPDLTTSYGGDIYEGVFLNQSGPPSWVPPYYSVQTQSTQTINGYTSYFQNWSVSGAILQSTTALTTPVVFTSAGATITANYKGNLISNSNTGFNSNSQRKVVRTDDGKLHMVYESLNQVWYTYSTDGGTTWQPEQKVDNFSTNTKSCSISQNSNIVFIVYQSDFGTGTIRAARFENGVRSWFTDVYSLSSYSYDTQPVIATYGSDGGLVVFKPTSTSPLRARNVKCTSISCTAGTVGTDFQISYSTANSVSPSLVYNSQKMFLAFQEGSSEIRYVKLSAGTDYEYVWETSLVSSGSPFTNNQSPSISVQAENPVVSWNGFNTPIPSAVIKRKTGTTWSNFNTFGSGTVRNTNNNSRRDGGEGSIIAWCDIYNANKFVKLDNGTYSSILTLPVGSGNGQIQVSNGIGFSDMKAVAYQQPTSGIYPVKFINYNFLTLQKINGTGNMNYGRMAIIHQNNKDFVYYLGDVKVDGKNIKFKPFVDSLNIENEEIMNDVMTTENFQLNPKSELAFSNLYYAFDNTDYKESKSNEVANSIELVNTNGKKVKAEFNASNYEQSKLTDDKTSFKVDCSNIEDGIYYLRVKSKPSGNATYYVNDMESEEPARLNKTFNEVKIADNALPTEFLLGDNYPNPFNPTTKISFSLPQKSQVKLKVFDVLGREIQILADGVYEAGKYEVEFNATNLPSGVYFYNLTTGTNSITKKMLLMK